MPAAFGAHRFCVRGVNFKANISGTKRATAAGSLRPGNAALNGLR
jgi:hypothetical protein